MVSGFLAFSKPYLPSSSFISFIYFARKAVSILILRNPGFTDSTDSNISSDSRSAATLSEIINGAHLYSFAAAIAPLHWNSQRSGLFESVTFPYFSSYPALTNAFVTSSDIKLISFFIVFLLIYSCFASNSEYTYISTQMNCFQYQPSFLPSE